MAGDAPWTPIFDFHDPAPHIQKTSKPPVQTLAILDKSNVIYLTKADPPPFAHRLANVVSKPENKSDVEMVRDPKTQQIKFRWRNPEEETPSIKISNVVSLADKENDDISSIGDDDNDGLPDENDARNEEIVAETDEPETEQSYRDKVELFWRRNCSANQEELSWGREYEDSEIPSTPALKFMSGA